MPITIPVEQLEDGTADLTQPIGTCDRCGEAFPKPRKLIDILRGKKWPDIHRAPWPAKTGAPDGSWFCSLKCCNEALAETGEDFRARHGIPVPNTKAVT